jgi:DNA-binding transcriptional ArsR family regulator
MYQPSPQIDPALLVKTSNSLKAIAHPVRLSMVELLKDGRKLNVTQIYEALGLEQAVASQHLSILKDKKIFTSERKGKHTYYFIKHDCVVDVIDLIISIHNAEEG